MARFNSIKRDKYDITFSKFILLRDGRICQRCFREGNQASHIHSRSNKGTRCHEKNAKCLCVTCHEWWHSNPLLAAEWCCGVMGQIEYDKLLRLAKTPSKMSVFDKDFIRKEQQAKIKIWESGKEEPVSWSTMWRQKRLSASPAVA